MTDTDPLTQEQMREGSHWVANERAVGRKVLVHCQHGRGRSIMLAAAILMTEGTSPTDAIDHIRSRRPLVALSSSQLAAVYEYGQRMATTAPQS
jgi:protein-tyrosine phosphatase